MTSSGAEPGRTKAENQMRGIRGRLTEWAKQISEFALAHGLGQAAGMLSGLIYVRYMPIDEYSLYALSLASLSMVGVGSDLGLTGSLNYFWRRRNQDWAAMAPIVAAVRRLRMILLFVAAIVCAVLLFRTAVAQEIALTSALGCLLLVVFTAAFQMRSVVDIQLLRLRGLQRKSYFADAAGSVARLVTALAMIATGIITAWFGLVGGLLGAITALVVVSVIVGTSHRVPTLIGRDTWSELGNYLLPVLPGVLVFMVQEPLVLWMAATYGGKVIVAEVFALGRIGAIFGLLGSFIVIVVTPRLARIVGDQHFTKVWLYVLAALVTISVVAVGMAFLWPSVPLILIGPKYAHLTSEIVIAIGTASIASLLTFLVLANRVRGWVRLDPFVAAVQAGIIVACVMNWSFGNAQSVLLLSMTLVGTQALMTFGVSLVGFLKPSLFDGR